MVVGFTVRLAPGHLIREMLVSHTSLWMSIASAAIFFRSYLSSVFGELVAMLL
jgi:hypothetical protein